MTMPRGNALEFIGISKQYGSHQVLSDVSFSVPEGEICGLIGENGAGKSTLIKCLMGVIPAYKGSFRVLGHVVEDGREFFARHVGFLLEPAFCAHLSARENLCLLGRLSGCGPERVDEVLELVSLANAAARSPKTFSYGMRQRLGLAQALLAEPELLVLDEPFVGLDPIGMDLMKGLFTQLAQQGVTILFSSHQVEDVEDICASVAVLHAGRFFGRHRIEDVTGIREIRLWLDHALSEADAASIAKGHPDMHIARSDAGAVDQVRVSGAQEMGHIVAALARLGYGIRDVQVFRHRVSELLSSSVEGARS